MFGMRPMEILLIVAVLVLLFGASRLPQLGASLGSGIRNFKKGFSGEETPEEAAAAKAATDKKLAEGGGTASATEKAASKQA